MERENCPPPRYYVNYEDKRIIASYKRRYGRDWRDALTNHDEIMSDANFEDLDAARVFRDKIMATDHYARIIERKFLTWVEDLKYWQYEGETIED